MKKWLKDKEVDIILYLVVWVVVVFCLGFVVGVYLAGL